jgi:hypothetical protein
VLLGVTVPVALGVPVVDVDDERVLLRVVLGVTVIVLLGVGVSAWTWRRALPVAGCGSESSRWGSADDVHLPKSALARATHSP